MSERNALAELAAWKNHKSKSARIDHENGYGATPGWEVELKSGKKCVYVSEATISDDEWPGLETVILAALDQWVEMERTLAAEVAKVGPDQ